MVSNRERPKKKKRKLHKRQEYEISEVRRQLRQLVTKLRTLLVGKSRRGDVGKLCQDISRLIDISEDNLNTAIKCKAVLTLVKAGKKSPIEAAHSLQSVTYYKKGREAAIEREDFLDMLSGWVKTPEPLMLRPVYRLLSNVVLEKNQAEKLMLKVDIIPWAARLLSDPEAPHAVICFVLNSICTFFPEKIPTFSELLIQAPSSLTNLIAAGVYDDDAFRQDTEGAQDLFDLLLLNNHIYPHTVFRDPSGEGVGAVLALVEEHVQAAKVCLSAWGTEDEGVKPLLSLPLKTSTMNMVMLAPHSKRIAKILKDRNGAVEHLVKHNPEVASELIEVLWPSEKKQKQVENIPLKDSFMEAIDKFIDQTSESSSEFFDIGDVQHRTEAAYALSSSRPGTIIFEKKSDFFGTCTVTRYPQWCTVRYNETEQGICYTGYPGVPGYNNGAPIATVLGYDYIKSMAAVMLKHSTVYKDLPVVCVGLGSGALPNFAAKLFDKASVVVYEIDPVSLEACEAMRFAAADNLNIVVSDAGKGLAKLPSAVCSVILLDAYNESGGIPKHLREKKFLSLVGSKLAHGGTVICNLHNGPPDSVARHQACEYIKKLSSAVGPVKIIKLTTQQSNLVVAAVKPQKKQQIVNETCTPNTSLLEFEPDHCLGDTFTYGDGPTDPDGLPTGLWGVDSKDSKETEEECEEDEENEEKKQEEECEPESSAESSTPRQRVIELIEISSGEGEREEPIKKKKSVKRKRKREPGEVPKKQRKKKKKLVKVKEEREKMS